jgi:hypothetical protein
MPKPAEIVAALGDLSAIDSYATLRAEMVDLFTDLVDLMKDRNDERRAQIFRKMADTVETIPYDMLAEFGHNYGWVMISVVLFEGDLASRCTRLRRCSRANAHPAG